MSSRPVVGTPPNAFAPGRFAHPTHYPAPWLTTIIDILGFVLVTYFHVNPTQYSNQPQEQG